MKNYSDKIKEELNKKIRDLKNAIDFADERKRMSKANTFEYKAISIVGMSMIAYVLLTMITTLVMATGVAIPSTVLLPTGFIGLSFLSGAVTNGLMNKHYKVKERFKEFSKTKTDREKLASEVEYSIYLEQAKNKKVILENVLANIENSEMLLKNSEVNLNSNISSECNINNLYELLAEQYDLFDTLTAKNAISKFFVSERDTYKKVMLAIIGFVFGFLIPFTLIFGPFMLFNVAVSPALMTSLGIVGSLVSGTFVLNKNNNCRKVFEEINKKFNTGLEWKTSDPYEEVSELEEEVTKESNKLVMLEQSICDEKQNAEELVSKREELSPSKRKELIEKLEKDAILEEDGPKLTLDYK